MNTLFDIEAVMPRVKVSDDHIAEVLAHWARYHPQGRPGPKERQKITNRFQEGYTVAQLCRAIDGIHKSSFHCGENDGGRTYLTLLVVFRDASQVEKFIELADHEAPVLSEKTRRSVRAGQRWAQGGSDE